MQMTWGSVLSQAEELLLKVQKWKSEMEKKGLRVNEDSGVWH